MRGLMTVLVTLAREFLFLALGVLGLVFVLVGMEVSLAEEVGFWTREMVQFHLSGFDATSLMVWRDGLGLIVLGGFGILGAAIHFAARDPEQVRTRRALRPLPPLSALPPIRR